MKLNPDCTRAILMAVEEACDCEHMFSYAACVGLKEQFSGEELCYHARQCDLAGFFYKYKVDLSGDWYVMDLTPKAHEFLANIRNDTIWNDVKTVCSKVGAKSLSAIAQIAATVVSEIIKAQVLHL